MQEDCENELNAVTAMGAVMQDDKRDAELGAADQLQAKVVQRFVHVPQKVADAVVDAEADAVVRTSSTATPAVLPVASPSAP